jgi:hypothetical protein
LPVYGTTAFDYLDTDRFGKSLMDSLLLTLALPCFLGWNIWKKRTRRVFDGISAASPRILALIKEEMRLRDLACGGVQPGE